MAQADLAKEAFDAGLSVKQLMASKEIEAKAKAKADADARKTAEVGVEVEVTPASTMRPADVLVVPAKGAEVPAVGVKRMPGDAPAPPSKCSRRRKPEDLGTRDGYIFALRLKFFVAHAPCCDAFVVMQGAAHD